MVQVGAHVPALDRDLEAARGEDDEVLADPAGALAAVPERREDDLRAPPSVSVSCL